MRHVVPVGQLRRIAAVMADDFALDHVFAADDDVFFRPMGRVNPLGRDDGNLFVPDAPAWFNSSTMTGSICAVWTEGR